MKFNKENLFNSHNVGLMIAAVIGLSLVFNTVKAVQRNYKLQQDVDKLKEEVSVLDLENQNLKLSIEYYKTDSYLELEAKQKFNKASPGESVLLLPKDGDGPANEQEQGGSTVDEKSNFEQWKYFLFGRHND